MESIRASRGQRPQQDYQETVRATSGSMVRDRDELLAANNQTVLKFDRAWLRFRLHGVRLTGRRLSHGALSPSSVTIILLVKAEAERNSASRSRKTLTFGTKSNWLTDEWLSGTRVHEFRHCFSAKLTRGIVNRHRKLATVEKTNVFFLLNGVHRCR